MLHWLELKSCECVPEKTSSCTTFFCKAVKLLMGQKLVKVAGATAGEDPHRFQRNDFIKETRLKQLSLQGSRYLSCTAAAAQTNTELLVVEK